ncbi:MAG: ATP-binding cassette domain-containing protein, partial [Ramlibacter sp.]|nr:ATP-binding cassette domain-containing protein [Ramlibacter sp.]
MSTALVMPGGYVAPMEQAGEQILRVESLTVSFDGFKAVDNLSLSVDRNELRVIIGPNGAGKTTLLD